MSLDPSMRASDADREAVAERLRDAHAEGRLTIEEFQERLDAAFAAKTRGELVPVTRDLPADSGAAVSVPSAAAATPYVGWARLRGVWSSWATAVVICVGIWATVSIGNQDWGYFWPIWVAGPWGAVLLARSMFGTERERPGRKDGERDHR